MRFFPFRGSYTGTILDLALKTNYDPLKNRGHPVLNPQAEPILRSAVQFNGAFAAAKAPQNLLVCSTKFDPFHSTISLTCYV